MYYVLLIKHCEIVDMGNTRGIDKDAKALNLVSIWLGMDDQWLDSSQIRREAAHKEGFSPSTITLFLNELVKKGILERPGKGGPEESDRKRLFRPTRAYWERYFQWIPIGPKANDSEFLLLSGFINDISNKFVETSNHALKKAPPKTVIRVLSGPKRKHLDAKIARLISTLRLDILRSARGYYDSGKGQQSNYELLRNNLMKAINAYLDLWDFVLTTNGATGDFNDRMEGLQKALKEMR
jgi:hypothetical protein